MRLDAEVRKSAWGALPDSVANQSTPTMLSLSELKMLHWFGQKLDLSVGAIVDAGSFLGGSTVALAEGIAARGEDHHLPTKLIVSYDMFLAPNDGYSLTMMRGRRPGDSVLDLFLTNVGPLAHMIDVRAGDFRNSLPPSGKISLCFLDIAKTWELNHHAISTLFTRMLKDKSYLIQQDYNDHFCPWVNVTMADLSDYFELLANDSSSRVYALRETLPPEKLTPLTARYSREGLLSLMDKEIEATEGSLSHFFNLVTKAWLLFEFFNQETAIEYLHSVSDLQPWVSSEPYVNIPIKAMQMLGDAASLNRFTETYFDDPTHTRLLVGDLKN